MATLPPDRPHPLGSTGRHWLAAAILAALVMLVSMAFWLEVRGDRGAYLIPPGEFITEGGVILRLRGSTGALVQSKDGGVRWKIVFTPPQGRLVDLHVVTERELWVTGDRGEVWRTTDGGEVWAQLSRGCGARVNAVAWLTAHTAVAVGPEGSIFRTTSAGARWVEIPSGVQEDLYSATFVAPEKLWVSGERGRLLYSQDAGKTWQPIASGTRSSLHQVIFEDERNGWAVGAGNAVIRTRNGGLRWHADQAGVRP
jgi:photosystem II stability/assembly factor-like uncharacterized protein